MPLPKLRLDVFISSLYAKSSNWSSGHWSHLLWHRSQTRRTPVSILTSRQRQSKEFLVSVLDVRTISHQSCAAFTGFRCGPCMEMYPWRRTCLSTGSMYISGECPRSSSFTVCIDWRCGAAESATVKIIVEGWVAYFFATQCTSSYINIIELIEQNSKTTCIFCLVRQGGTEQDAVRRQTSPLLFSTDNKEQEGGINEWNYGAIEVD